MPLFIVKNDITNMKTDAIVNAANNQLAQGSGVCGAIFRAAGSKRLTKACQKIGSVSTGEAVITRGFDLDAKYIIHTAGPVYDGGTECDELLYRSYYNSIQLAASYRCKSISFPLISSGVYGYPMDKAIEIAKEGIHDGMAGNEMTVFLVVFDAANYNNAMDNASEVDKYISEIARASKKTNNIFKPYKPRHAREESIVHYAPHPLMHDEYACAEEDMSAFDARPKAKASSSAKAQKPRTAKPAKNKADTRKSLHSTSEIDLFGENERAEYNQKLDNSIDEFYPQPYDYVPYKESMVTPAFCGDSTVQLSYEPKTSLEDMIANLDASFSQTTIRLILEKELDHKEVYRRANMTRQHFSKIKCNPSYIPSKSTILALAIAMRLNYEETQEYLKTSGFALSRSSVFDVIVEYHITHEIYDIFAVNDQLFCHDQPLLGTKM